MGGLLIFAQDADSGAESEFTWQEFEERVRDALDSAGYRIEFRRVFKSGGKRHEVDVIAHKFDLCILIDAKRYGKGRYRASSLKSEAKKHFNRCRAFETTFKSTVIPVLVSWIDDSLVFQEGCFIVPFEKLQDFVNNVELYVDSMGDMTQFIDSVHCTFDDQ
jgi:Holliday junction resolvase-like predicted endonuclease